MDKINNALSRKTLCSFSRYLFSITFLFCLLTSISEIAQAQNDYADVTITVSHIGGNVYMLKGAGGNIGVSVGDDGVLMIDDQFAPLSEKIRAAINSIDGKTLRFLLNTHWHGDHVGGNEIFGNEATIIAHDNVRTRLSTEQTLFGDIVSARPKQAWPVITFSSSLSIHFNGEEISVRHYPGGHTDGDAVIFFAQSNVIHMGDLFFNGMFPFVDLEHGGNALRFLANVTEIIESIDSTAKIIPGHGPSADINDLREFHRMLTETIGYVKNELNSGKSMEQIQKSGLPEEWSDWSWAFITTEKWIATITESINTESPNTASPNTGTLK